MESRTYKELKQLRVKYPIDFINCKQIKGITDITQLPLNEWVVIDTSNIGINYCLYTGEMVYIDTQRMYSKETGQYTPKAFNQWRKEIK